MEYPECPHKYTLAWLENPVNTFTLYCRPLSSEENEATLYINKLLYTLYVIPALFVGLLCIMCIYSNSRYYRTRKDSGLTSNQV